MTDTTDPQAGRLEAAARRALESLNDLILDSRDPGPEAIAARYELEQVLLTLSAGPAHADRAAIYREVADRLAADAEQGEKEGLTRIYRRSAARQVREWADQAQQPETEDGEAEKLAKARRMAKALSAPPVAPPEWDATKEWPMRHKRARDRRVHATARFSVNGTQRIWTACGKQVGEGGYPINHMPVDCRNCSRATEADEAQQPETQAEAHPPTVAWEIESPRRGTWASWGTTYDEHDWARERFQDAIGHVPARQFRLVRATTVYVVEAEHDPAAMSQPGGARQAETAGEQQ